MKKVTVILMLLCAASANAAITGVVGPNSSAGVAPAIIGAPAHLLDDVVFNQGMQGFDEAQGVITTAAHGIDGGGNIAVGTRVDSHMIFLNSRDTSRLGHVSVDWTFDGTIIGVMSDSGGTLEAASTFELGNPGTNYTVPFSGSGPAAPFGARGLESNNGTGAGPNDGYLILNPNTIRVSMLVTEPGDWMRVVTATTVPAPGAFVLAGLGTSLVGFMRRRKSI